MEIFECRSLASKSEAKEAKLMGKFEIFKDVAGQYRFRLKAANGQIIATSEAYITKQGCKNAIIAVQTYAPSASVIDLT